MRVSRAGYKRAWRKTRGKGVGRGKANSPIIIGIDGEGITIEGEHKYVYLAAWSEDTCIAATENREGLSTVECLEFLIAVKRAEPNSLLVGFSLGYDYTMMLKNLPNRTLYMLMRPELRKNGKAQKPVYWKGYKLNFLRNRLSVSRKDGTDSLVLWDVWGFFQGTFIDACKNWGVVTPEEYNQLAGMKARRSEFSWAEFASITSYCGQECRKMALLASRLIAAHGEAGLELRSYFGAGSTASALLARMGIKAFMPSPESIPLEVEQASRFAFFGGRFEIARFGPIQQPLYGYDIASAYPYQLYQLPCLQCGKWRKVTKNIHQEVERSRFALVRYVLPVTDVIRRNASTMSSPMTWGPFPFRANKLASEGIEDGSIIYPVSSGGGWVYREEYLVGCHWFNVVPLEAWIYETNCEHHPFEGIRDMYIARLQWGKEGRGIVAKLGCNSCYGKLAQSVGDNPPYQCFLWAGAITSGTRAQLLRMILQGDCLLTATDGIIAGRKLDLEIPLFTGTEEQAIKHGKPPLGAWETKDYPNGMMLIRPGIAFPLDSNEVKLIRPGIAFPLDSNEVKETKARGLGKAVLTKHKQAVLDSWKTDGPKAITLDSVMFHGAKSSITHSSKGYRRAERYGQWRPRETILSYMPEPKRPFVMTDGRLHTWALDSHMTSAPYRRILTSEAKAVREAETLERGQP